MSGTGGAPEFNRWAATVLAGTGWTPETLREAADRPSDDLATAALADGFAAAHGVAPDEQGGQL
ncbi:MAG: chemotaxis protein [Actinomycetia bacterium]|nr:chemotaxis protein [Actinomycetes bacterium]